MDSHGRTVLVTGGAGFIGGELVTRLLSVPDQHVVCIDKLTYSANRSMLTTHIAAGLEFHPLDLAEADAVDEVVASASPDVIFHLAAESHVDRSIDGPAPFIDTNVVGTLNLLQASLGHWRSLEPARAGGFLLVHVSTDEVFGSAAPNAFFTEQTRYDPRSPYSASKAAADHLVRAWHATYGLPTIVTTTSNNYGPFQFPEKLIPHTVVRALTGESIAVYGDGQHVRDWIHVSDHVDGLIRAAEHGQGGDNFLFGARNAMANLDLVERICSILDEVAPDSTSHRSRIEFVDDRPGHDRRYAIDASKIRAELGWRPQRDLAKGLAETVRWYLEHRDWCEEVQAGGYARERLGLG
jgi:dTDP-glucose 4,6-dehydratase